MNKVIIIGRTGKEPETKHLENGNQVSNFSIATSEKYKNKQGETVENTEWHNLVAWGKLSELIEKYVKKGDKVGIVGKLATRSWDDSNGNKKYATEIVVNEVEFLGNRASQEEPQAQSQDEDGDLPF